jgi:hypothetical protein
MQLDPRSVVVGYGLAKMQMSAELADLRAGMEAELADLRARIESEWAALRSELAAGLRAARAELENLETLRVADEAAKSELAGRRTFRGRRPARPGSSPGACVLRRGTSIALRGRGLSHAIDTQYAPDATLN